MLDFSLIAVAVIATVIYPMFPERLARDGEAADGVLNLIRGLVKVVPVGVMTFIAGRYGAHVYLVSGLFLSMLGDFALSRPGRAAFLYGLTAFAMAHVFYAWLFLDLGAGFEAAFLTAPVAILALLMLAASTELWLTPFAGKLAWPVRAYIALILSMVAASFGLPPGYGIAIAGAMAFLLSDLILGLREFRLPAAGPRGRGLMGPAHVVLWGLYVGGQGLILWGIAGADLVQKMGFSGSQG